jgi:hypothetical protein
MTKCSAIKANGARCKRVVGVSKQYCYAHDPERAQERRANNSKAGSWARGGEITKTKDRIRELAEAVIAGKLDRGRASVAFQGLGVLKGFMELERRVRETDELAAEVAELKQLVDASVGSRNRWG